jgi:hypothetical protein
VGGRRASPDLHHRARAGDQRPARAPPPDAQPQHDDPRGGGLADGRTVAYARAGALHLIDVRTGRGRAIGSRRVGTGPLIDVAWTPDGRRLAYVRYPRHRRFELEEIRTSGHDRRRLFRFPAGVAILSITFTAG